MMDFLDTLFGYEYFGPILFAIIAILIVLFFIILFFGKKDEKERILEETRRLELASLNAFKEESEEQSKLEIKEKEDLKPALEIENKEEVFEKQVEEINPPMENIEIKIAESEELSEPLLTPILETPLVMNYDNKVDEETKLIENPVESVFKIEPSIPTDIPKYDFEELANSISKELEEIEKISNLKQEEKTLEKEEPKLIIEDSQVEVTPIKEIKKFKPSPVFSSVFVPQKEEKVEVKKEEVNEEIKPMAIPVVFEEDKDEIQQVEIPIMVEKSIESEIKEEKTIDFSVLKAKTNQSQSVVKPKVELPKQVELPKKVNKNIMETNVPDFEDIQGESYNISR